MVLLLDEAHAMDIDDLSELLNVLQDMNVASRGGRVLAVLAGTPGLLHTAEEAVSFSERLAVLDVGLLDREAALDALRVPMEENGLAFDRGILERVAEDAQRYPYFLQLWGRALWDAAHDVAEARGGSPVVDGEALDRVVAEGTVESRRKLFYGERRDGLDDDGLLEAAKAVALSFHEAASGSGDSLPTLAPDIARAAVRAAVGGDGPEGNARTQEALRGLVAHGFIWRGEKTGDLYLPGIPSLMDHVRSA